MNRTDIEYLDLTWNPEVGCNGIGCEVRDRCWARAQAKRQKHKCRLCYVFTPHFHTERLLEPTKRKKPSRIGVCFMGDLFDSQNGWGMVAPVLTITWECPQHRFYILTKQPQNAKNYPEYPDNVWIGVTVNCKNDLWRIGELRNINAKIKFVSFEPLYEDLGDFDLKGINWVIIGAQTRPKILPKIKWVSKLIGTASFLDIPVFLKNNLHAPIKIQEFPEA